MDVFLAELAGAPLAFVAGAAFLGGVTQGSLGFGASFMAVPALALTAPELLPGAMLVAILPLSIVMALRSRRDIDTHGLVWLTVGRMPGIVVGAVTVAVLPVRALTAAIAVLLLLAVAAAGWGHSLTVTGPREVVAGFVSGLTGTAAALGGPPLALLYRGRTGAVMRPTLAAVWAIGIVPALVSLTLAGEFTREQAGAGCLLAIATLAGLTVAAPIVRSVPDPTIRRAVLWWAAVGGVLALARAILG